MALNKVIIMGRLCANPELRHTASGTPVTSVTLAVDRDFKSQSGESETDFIEVVAWKNTANFLSRYFTKGRMAVVEGRLQMREWSDKDGKKRKNAEVVADSVYFGDSKTTTQEDRFNDSFDRADNFHEEEDDGTLPF